ncbi:ETS homologous factor isoform X2 [Amia ocellicauda]|uniref:ETS homologous factor isoform X2 n=1 Tax=Amia ocellicauda TaxID=2972642 RepID=UPI003464953E
MVRHNSSIMSIPSIASIESQLPAAWSPHYTSTDVSTTVPGYPGRLLQQEIHPQFWSKFQVWEWLQQTLDVNQIDATSIPFQNFDIDGRQLCTMSYQDFTRAAGSVGPLLFQSLTDIKWNEFSCSILPFKEESCYYNCSNADFFDIKTPFQPSIAITTVPSSPEAKRQHSRPQSAQVKKHNPRGTHLWEFIRDILLNPERNPGLIKWEDRSEGVFRFLKSEAVAQLWGKKKNNSSMTYEKLSRAMRYYYKREILERVDGRRLVYKFGRNARGWKESEK